MFYFTEIAGRNTDYTLKGAAEGIIAAVAHLLGGILYRDSGFEQLAGVGDPLLFQIRAEGHAEDIFERRIQLPLGFAKPFGQHGQI